VQQSKRRTASGNPTPMRTAGVTALVFASASDTNVVDSAAAAVRDVVPDVSPEELQLDEKYM
jgi:hypothetical protein